MRNKKIIGVTIISIIFVLFLFAGYNIQKNKSENTASDITVTSSNKYSDENLSNESENYSSDKKKISAQIYGEVKKPGVYSLANGKRIEDLVNMAGGFTNNADAFSVNGAKKLNDGDNIEVKNKNSQNTSKVENDASNTDNEKLEINSVTEEDIVNKKIPGIGKGLADKIIKYREANGGRINSEKDLEKAIGPTRAKKIMDYIDIN